MVTKIAKPIRRMRRKEATRKESSNVAVIPEDLGKIPITTPELRVRESTSQTGLVKRTVAVLEGDGIGPEIMEEAVQTVELSGKLSGNEFKFIYAPFGAQAYFDYGHPFPKETKKLVVEADSVLKGPVGLPADEMDRIPVHLRPEKAGLLPLRTLLDTYFGLRPGRLSKSYADFSPLKLERIKEGIDILVAREQTEGIYFGKKVEGEETGMQYAIDECKYTREGVERFAHACFREAMKRGGKLTHVHKSNVEATSRFRDAIFRKIAPQYPGVEITTFMIDNFHYQLFIDPTQFKFVVMGNKDGDTGSDGVAGAVGSLGLMRTACWNPEKRKGYF